MMPGLSLSGEAAGLVSFKTSENTPQQDGTCIDDLAEVIRLSLDEEQVFERRHARLRRNVFFAGNAITRTVPYGYRAWMVTLTYADVGTTTPRDLSRALDHFRKWTRRRGMKATPYLWVAELQQRGAVHYHLLVWLPKKLALPKFDKQGWWTHGMTRNDRIKHSAVGYAMKYCGKWDAEHCKFPPDIRLYGSGGLDLADRRIRQWTNLPGWARAEFGVGELRRSKHGLLDIDTGELLQPRYAAVIAGRTLVLVKLQETKDRWYDGPYSNIFPNDDAAGSSTYLH